MAINIIPAEDNDISTLPQLSHLLSIMQRKWLKQQQLTSPPNKLTWGVHVLQQNQKQQEKLRQGFSPDYQAHSNGSNGDNLQELPDKEFKMFITMFKQREDAVTAF